MMNRNGHDPFSLFSRHILVTGASSGIGRQTAIWLSKQGARLILVARNHDRLLATYESLIGSGHTIEQFDFTDGADVSEWMKRLAKENGPFDGMVHAAGIQKTMPIRASTMEQWEQLMKTNVTSTFSLIKAFRQKGVCMSESSIVLLSSVMAQKGKPALLGYCASKGAIESMVRAAALELAKEGIRVNAVAPGVVKTEMAENLKNIIGDNAMLAIEQQHPLGLGTPLDVAYAINYLLAPASRWITGTSLVIDGGYLVQ